MAATGIDIKATGITAAKLTLLYAGVSSLWIFFSGYLLELVIDDPLSRGRLELAKGIAFVLLTSTLLYMLLRSREAMLPARADFKHPPAGHGIFAVIIALLLAVPLTGYGILRLYTPALEQQINAGLEDMVALKTAELDLWRRERLRTIVSLARSDDFIEDALALQSRDDTEARRHLRDHLQALLRTYGYSSLSILAADGTVLLAIGDSAPLPESTRQLMASVADSGSAAHGEIFLDSADKPDTDRIRIDFVAPLPMELQSPSDRLFLLATTHPAKFLTALLKQHSPVGNFDAEFSLVHRDSRSAIFLTLPHSADAEAKILRLTGDSANRVAATAINSAGSGLTEGLDYQGNRVYAAYRPIDSTGWVMLAKLDRAAALAPLRVMASWISIFIFFAAVAISGVLVALWQQQRRNYQLLLAGQSAEHDKRLREQEAVYREMFEANPHPMWVYDTQTLRFLAVNDAAISHYGYSREDFLGMTIADIRPPEDISRLHEHLTSQPANREH